MHEVQFYAFDCLVSDGEDLRRLPLSMRKASLARLLARRVDGIFLSDFEQGEIGPDLFRHACLMGLEGLVSKHRESIRIAPAGRHTGSRSRTGTMQPSAAYRISSKQSVPCWPLRSLGQGQEPAASSVQAASRISLAKQG